MFQTLKQEFEDHDTLLNDLEKQAGEYRRAGKAEAAARLEQQVQILRVRSILYRGASFSLMLSYIYTFRKTFCIISEFFIETTLYPWIYMHNIESKETQRYINFAHVIEK